MPKLSNNIRKWRFTLYVELHPTDTVPCACQYFFYKNDGGNQFYNGDLKKKADEVAKRSELVDDDELGITVDEQKGNLAHNPSQC
jgi:hypothetical protein